MPMAQINGVRMHYHVKGSGLPILFVPPPLLTLETFNYQKEQLSDAFQVITYDLRGHGQSGRSSAPLSYPLLAEDIKQLLDLLGLRQAYICGYSTGGQLALAAMLAYPDRFLGGIVVSGMSEVSDLYLRLRITAAEYVSKLRCKRLLCSLMTAGNSDSRQTFQQLYGQARKGHSKSFGEYFKISREYNCTSRLRAIKAPILLIYGQKDPSFFRYARILQNGLPHCTLHMIPGVKHQIPVKAPGEMNRVIRAWVEEQSRKEHSGPEQERGGRDAATKHDIPEAEEAGRFAVPPQ